MKKATLKCPAVWTLLSAVDDGKLYFITNNGETEVRYSISDQPADTDKGSVLPAKCQISFSKVSKSMYIKNLKPECICDLYVEQYEPKED